MTTELHTLEALFTLPMLTECFNIHVYSKPHNIPCSNITLVVMNFSIPNRAHIISTASRVFCKYMYNSFKGCGVVACTEVCKHLIHLE